MPLRIRCPHCQAAQVVPDDAAGEQRACAACGQFLTVPLPRRAVEGEAAPTELADRCPRCGAKAAPGTTRCQRCLTDLVSGARPSWRERLRFMGLAARLGWAVAALGAVALLLVGVNLFLQRDTRPAEVASTLAPPPREDRSAAAANWAGVLLAARSAAERDAAARELVKRMPEAGAALADAIGASLAKASPRQRPNQLAAIDLLGGAPAAAALPVLERCGQVAALRARAARSRGRLGDARIVGELVAQWTGRVRAALFAARLQSLVADVDAEAVRTYQREAEADGAALSALGLPAIERCAAGFWDSWKWLGQERGEGYAAAVFYAARPRAAGGADTPAALTGEIRGARDRIIEVAMQAPPAVRAAAGVILTLSAPQYESARERIVALLARELAAENPAALAETIIAIAVLSGRPFAGASQNSSPADVDAAAVAAARAWAAEAGLIAPRPGSAARELLPERPRLVRRVVPVRSQREAEFLGRVATDWNGARDAVAAWLASELGLTPRARRLFDVRQHDAPPHALAAGITLAGALGDGPAETQLALWCDAADQPAWVRNLARTALACAQARRGAASGAWPGNLEIAALQASDRAEPGLWFIGRLIAAGGERLRSRLSEEAAPGIPAAVRARLSRAADEALRTRGAEAWR